MTNYAAILHPRYIQMRGRETALVYTTEDNGLFYAFSWYKYGSRPNSHPPTTLARC